MNLMITLDEDLLCRSRELARRRGTSLQELLRSYLESLVETVPADRVADELLELMDSHGGRSGGRSFRREDGYADRA